MNDTIDSNLMEQQSLQRSTILRVYNYYRILISFLFLYLFLEPNFQAFVGSVNPELFQTTIISYILANILIGLATFFIRVEILSKTTPSLIILIGDIICLTLLMSASGGVSSGLGNFLIFTLAFGGGLILGRVSTVLPAIAFILTIYNEFYLFFLDKNEVQSFFQAGILGIVYFASNILFQTLARQLRSRASEVFTLEQINQLAIERMRTGIIVVADNEDIKLINGAAKKLLLDTRSLLKPQDHIPDTLREKLSEWKHSPSDSPTRFAPYDTGPELIANFSPLTGAATRADTLIFIEDSTEIQRQAQQLKLASVGRLSASIAHEIRNPLGAISHAAQLLGESEHLDSGDKRLSDIIQSHCIRMNGVIENVLQMSRRKLPDTKKITIDSWLDNFIDEFSAGFGADINIDIEIKDANVVVNADPVHLSQILGNLCQNGLRYSEKNTGRRDVKIDVGLDAISGKPYLALIDYGTGVNDDDLANLFEPFFTTETSGTGLGLYLSKELCEANDARLSYAKAATGGSCFRVSFFN